MKVDDMNHGSVFEKSAANLRAACSDLYPAAIAAAVDTIVHAFQAGGKLFVFGNGGPCTDAEHICGELVGRFLRDRRGLPALALSSNSAALTVIGNDYGFEAIFERRIQALARDGDVAWGISTSGDSEKCRSRSQVHQRIGPENSRVDRARRRKIRAVERCSAGGSVGRNPSNPGSAPVTYHTICGAIEARIFGTAGRPADNTVPAIVSQVNQR